MTLIAGRFNAGVISGARLASDGRTYIETDSGQQQFLETAPPLGAVHGNAGFEDVTAGVPDLWDFGWQVGGSTASSEATLVYSGEKSLHVHIPAGGGHLLVLSNAYDIPLGGSTDFWFMGMKTLGSPVISLGQLTKASGTPAPLNHPTSINNEESPVALTADWAMFRRQASAVAGHARGRLFARVASSGTEECDAYLDLSASATSAANVYETGWLTLPFTAGWGSAGSPEAPCEYRRTGDVVYLRGMLERTGSSTSALAPVVATLTPECWPTDGIRRTQGGGAYLTTAGELTLDNSSGLPLVTGTRRLLDAVIPL